MFDLEKLKDNNAVFWTFQMPELRRIAAECGWAIAVHGSALHDLDLMAMPWTERHTTADELAQRFTDTNQPEFRRPYEKSQPGDKPSHRTVYTIYMGQTYIDMNIIDSGDSHDNKVPFREWRSPKDNPSRETCIIVRKKGGDVVPAMWYSGKVFYEMRCAKRRWDMAETYLLENFFQEGDQWAYMDSLKIQK